jgi:hypothetical protein
MQAGSMSYKIMKMQKVPNIGQGEARHRQYKGLELGGGQVTRLPL